MRMNDLTQDSIPLILQDCIDNKNGAVWDLIRKVPYFYYNRNSTPDWFHDPCYSSDSIYFLNPLNHKVIEVWYSNGDWRILCNFTNHRATECTVLVGSINEDCLAALLPYSGMAEEDYDDLPF